MDSNTDIRGQVRRFLSEDPIYRGFIPSDFSDDFALIGSGALDSVGIFNLVNFLEKTFALHIEARDLNEAHFGTLLLIEAFVRSRASRPLTES